MRIQIRFSFDHQKDADILEYLDGLPSHQRSIVVRDLLRVHIRHDGITLGNIWDDLQALKAMNLNLQGRAISVQREEGEPSEVDEEILKNLDKLGVD